MRKKYIFGKKLYISVLTTILILLTTVATTFAWIGVFANSTFDTFFVNIKSSDLDEYGIEISLTGKPNSFSDSISGKDVKKAILLNWGYLEHQITDNNIDDLFSTLNMEQVTTIPNVTNGDIISLGDFKNIQGENSNAYFKFDIYVSTVQFYDGDNSDFKLDVFLDKGLISGSTKKKLLVNPFTYPATFNNPLSSGNLPIGINPIMAGDKITQSKVNSKSVCRVGFEKYAIVDKYHPEQYNSSSPISSIIYSGDDYNYPTHNTNTDVYEFGGILEDDLNVALGYYNSTEWWYSRAGIKTVSLLDSTADIYGGEVYSIRGVNGTNPDQLFSSNTNHLIDSSKPTEQMSVNQMMKITVSFWIEGWDSDCFNAIGGSPVTLSISMSTKNEESF